MNLNKKHFFIAFFTLLFTFTVFCETPLTVQIIKLEYQISQMEHRLGEYQNMDQAKLERLIIQKKKELAKLQAKNEKQTKENTQKAKIEAKKEAKEIKKGFERSGEDLKQAPKKMKREIKKLFK